MLTAGPCAPLTGHTMSSQTQTQEKTRTELRYPDRYQVIIWNDDFTPMDFVISLLVEVFNKKLATATELTMSIHEEGCAVAGVYFREIAEQKVSESNSLASLNNHPLKITMEVIE